MINGDTMPDKNKLENSNIPSTPGSEIYRIIFETSEDAVFIADGALRVIEANPAGLDLCGYGAREIAGIKLSGLIHPEDLDSCPFPTDERTAANDGQFSRRARIIKKDKTCVNAELSFDALPDGLYTLTAAFSNSANGRAARSGADKFKNEAVLRKTVDTLPLWISCVDSEGRYIFANQYYSDTFKIPLEKIEGHNFKEFFPPALYEKHKRLLDRCIESRASVTFEDEADLENGVKATLYGVYTPFFDENQTVHRISVAAFDITAKKELELQAEKAAEALRKSEEKYKTLVDNAICGIGVAKGDKIIYANRTLLNMHGYDDFSEFSSKKLIDYHTPESQKTIAGWRKKKARGEAVPNEFEVEIIRKDGRIRTLFIRVAKIKLNNEICSQTTFIDVTEKKKIENELKELTARYEYIVAASGMAAYEYNTETGEMLWGTSTEKMIGFKNEEIGNAVEAWLEMLHPEDREEAVIKLKEAEASGSSIDDEYRLRHKNGNYIWVRDRGIFLRDESGKAVRQVGMLEDITDRKKADAELISALEEAEAASRAKNLFLANISHEIRTPMNGIIGFTNLMGASGLDDEQKEYNHIIKASCGHLLSLIDDILDFSKLEAKKLELENRPFDIRESLYTSINLISEHAKIKKLEVETHVDEAICYRVSGDERRFRQILINLLTNAVKFTFTGKIGAGVSQASANDETAVISIEVYDTGIGFPAEKADEIFEVFHQLDESSTKRHVGTGIGLSIVKRLVEMMGGAINVTSEPGKGSRFKVVLPFKIVRGEGEVREKSNHNDRISAEGETIKVLLAEDDSISRALVEAICCKNGWDISIAGNGFEMFEMYKKEKFDVVLMDGRMPEMDGFEATSRIREFEKKSGRRVPIMAITAYALDGDREKFIAAGADDYISKPIESDDIFTEKILELLNKNNNGI